MTKYRLKKDAPMNKAGDVFELHDCELPYLASAHCQTQYQMNKIKNFDEWFEEVKDEPKYLRRLVKELKFGKKNEIEIIFRFTKDWYYYCYDEVMSIGMFNGYDEGIVERLRLGKKDGVLAIGIAIKSLNQLVRDGYIEIEDNPNIVWEDSDEN